MSRPSSFHRWRGSCTTTALTVSLIQKYDKTTMIVRTMFLAVAFLLSASTLHAAEFQAVACEGVYPHHLQGICTDEDEAIFWSFTTRLVKTDTGGKVVKQVDVANHHGDLCWHDGKVYVAVNLGRFNDPKGNADSWVYVYEADDLMLVAKHKTPEVFHGAGGIAHHDRRFIVVGGLPEGVEENYVYKYEEDFRFVKKLVIESGHTQLGIQTAAFADGHWWFGCYGKKLLKTDESFKMVGKYDFDCGLGVVGIVPGRFLVGRGGGAGDRRTGSVVVAKSDGKQGLVIQLKTAGNSEE